MVPITLTNNGEPVETGTQSVDNADDATSVALIITGKREACAYQAESSKRKLFY